jgi:hypothetical protein
MADYPMPGRSEFSAAEEKYMRKTSRDSPMARPGERGLSPQRAIAPAPNFDKFLAMGGDVPADDATDEQ